MPKGRAITSPKQFGMMEAAMHGKAYKGGPSPDVAKKLLAETTHERKSAFAKELMAGRKKNKKRH